MRYAQLDETGLAVNVIEAEDDFVALWSAAVALVPGIHATPPLVLVEGREPEPGIGWAYLDGRWSPPDEPDEQAAEPSPELRAAARVVAQQADPDQPDPQPAALVAAVAVVLAADPAVAALAGEG